MSDRIISGTDSHCEEDKALCLDEESDVCSQCCQAEHAAIDDENDRKMNLSLGTALRSFGGPGRAQDISAGSDDDDQASGTSLPSDGYKSCGSWEIDEERKDRQLADKHETISDKIRDETNSRGSWMEAKSTDKSMHRLLQQQQQQHLL